MIRKANEMDIPSIAAMGRKFHAMSTHHHMGEYDEEAICRMLSFMVGSDHAVVLTNGQGFIGGVVAPIYFNPAKLMMEESFWWAERGGRDLLKALEKEAKIMGASCLCLSTLDNDRSNVIGRVVTGSGYAPLERRYVKELQ